MFDQGWSKTRELMAVQSNGFSLASGKDKKRSSGDAILPTYNSILKRWGMMYPFGFGNRRIVLRSQSLLNYGDNFDYWERKTNRSWGSAWCTTITMMMFFLCVLIPPVRWWILPCFLPSPGEGPSRETCT
eukprot:UN05723